MAPPSSRPATSVGALAGRSQVERDSATEKTQREQVRPHLDRRDEQDVRREQERRAQKAPRRPGDERESGGHRAEEQQEGDPARGEQWRGRARIEGQKQRRQPELQQREVGGEIVAAGEAPLGRLRAPMQVEKLVDSERLAKRQAHQDEDGRD